MAPLFQNTVKNMKSLLNGGKSKILKQKLITHNAENS